jgi:hypothetical protein
MRHLYKGRSLFVLPVTLACLVTYQAPLARGQGCIVAQSSSVDISPESQGGYLQGGDWELTVDYRRQFSYKHSVSEVEQTYRVQQGTEVMNKINLEDLNLTYQATDRFGFTLTVPVLFARGCGAEPVLSPVNQSTKDAVNEIIAILARRASRFRLSTGTATACAREVRQRTSE